jgi:hypothetical protein
MQRGLTACKKVHAKVLGAYSSPVVRQQAWKMLKGSEVEAEQEGTERQVERELRPRDKEE